MKISRLLIALAMGIASVLSLSRIAICLSPADTLRNEHGEIFNVVQPGQPGAEFVKQQFIISLLPGYLTLPVGASEANLSQCTVEQNLRTILERNNVTYVKQVFTGYQLGDTLRIVGSDTCKVPDLSQVYLLLQSIDSGVIPAVNDMYNHEASQYAEPNFSRKVERTPNDTYWSAQWNLKNIGNGIGCETAWDGTVGSQTIKIAILDTGIDYNHTDLGGPGFPNSKIAGGYDYAYGDNDPMDIYGHGTSCTGIAGALSNNATKIAGISGGWNRNQSDKGNRIYAIKVLHDDGSGNEDEIARGIREAADPNIFGCNILSNSYGGYGYSETERLAVSFAYRVGASFVASKGNNGRSDPHFPSDFDYSWVTAVASYGRNGHYCQGDNCGYSSNFGQGIDVTAPGTEIPATAINNGYTAYFGGTSAACPHVAGSIGLVRSVKTGLRNEDTDWMLKFSANDNNLDGGDNNVWTWNERYGHGDLRISTAMQRLASPLIRPFDYIAHSATGGIDVGHTGFMRYTFSGSPLRGLYLVRMHDVRVNVTYPESFAAMPFVWGVGYNTTGWSGANPNYQVGFCQLIFGSQTATGCQLQTFVYEVYNLMGQFIGWYPCQPGQVSLQYRLWGNKNDITPTMPGQGKISDNPLPEEFYTPSIYPNPFNASASIKFNTSDISNIQLEIYDLLGRKVVTLFEGSVLKGAHNINWAGKNEQGDAVPSGIYFCRLVTNGIVSTQKLTMLR